MSRAHPDEMLSQNVAHLLRYTWNSWTVQLDDSHYLPVFGTVSTDAWMSGAYAAAYWLCKSFIWRWAGFTLLLVLASTEMKYTTKASYSGRHSHWALERVLKDRVLLEPEFADDILPDDSVSQAGLKLSRNASTPSSCDQNPSEVSIGSRCKTITLKATKPCQALPSLKPSPKPSPKPKPKGWWWCPSAQQARAKT